ncbi:MAG: methylated-DNA--[protein]-cysteine S-methyltransferase [Thermodesulfobacteriota bacterium]
MKRGICSLSIFEDEELFLKRLKGRYISHPVSSNRPCGDVKRVYLHRDFTLKELSLLRDVITGLERYFSVKKTEFNLPLVPIGTVFERAVWDVLMTIPYGETRSYGWVAGRLGNPKAARAVGAACKNNPIPIVIPCHRVVAADGGLGGYSGGCCKKEGIVIKKKLLELEGVMI